MQEADHRDRDPDFVNVVSMVGRDKDDTVFARQWVSLRQPTRPIDWQAEVAKEFIIRQPPIPALPVSDHLEPSCVCCHVFLHQSLAEFNNANGPFGMVKRDRRAQALNVVDRQATRPRIRERLLWGTV